MYTARIESRYPEKRLTHLSSSVSTAIYVRQRQNEIDDKRLCEIEKETLCFERFFVICMFTVLFTLFSTNYGEFRYSDGI